MSDNTKVKKGCVTWIKNKPYDAWRYDNERAIEDNNARQFMTGNSNSLSSKEIKSNYWLDKSDFE